MGSKPPEDELYPSGLRSNQVPPHVKWEKDATREVRQHRAIKTMQGGNNFSLACLLLLDTKHTDLNPKELNFAAKGIVRCALAGDKDGREWRRLFGVKKDRWVTDNTKKRYRQNHTIEAQISNGKGKDLFEKWEDLEEKDIKELPVIWKSRVLVQAYKDLETLCGRLSGCPLRHWSGIAECPLSGAIGSCSPGQNLILLQVHDHLWHDGKKLSQWLSEVFAKNSGLKLVAIAECMERRNNSEIGATSQGGAAKTSMLEGALFPLRIAWKIEQISPLCTGMGQDFAEAFDGRQEGQVTRNLVLHNLGAHGGDPPFKPAVLVSSVRGVFRSAVSWLLESLQQQAEPSLPFLTSDYAPDPKKPCPVERIFGRALDDQGPFSSHRSPVRFGAQESGSEGLASSFPAKCEDLGDPLRYGWQVLQGAKQKLSEKEREKVKARVRIEEVEIDASYRLVTEIGDGPDSLRVLAAVCLAADLIGSGFFRLGRFTSRGYGVLRLHPEKIVSVARWFDPAQEPKVLLGADSDKPRTGLTLLTEIFGIDSPAELLSQWLKEFRS